MQKKVLFRSIIISILFFVIFSCINVKAACSTEEKNKLIQLAYNVKFDYELSDESTSKNKLFKITLSNLTKGIYAKYSSYIYKYIEDNLTPGIEKLNPDFKDNSSYEIKFYGDTKTCDDVFLVSRTVTIPKYNVYSEREECKGIEDFKLCNKWYQGEISSLNYFKEEVNKYKENLNKKESTKTENKKTIIGSFVEMYQKNLIVSVIVTILFIVAIIVLVIGIIKRRKNRIKIEI